MRMIKLFLKLMNHQNVKNKKFLVLLKIFWWKINQYIFKVPVITTLHNNINIICEPQSSYGSYVFYAQFPEFEEMMLIMDLINENDVVFDVGANIGAISLLMASKIKNGKIHLFEPTESLISKINQNIQINNFENKIVINKLAIAEKSGNIYFTYENESEINHISNIEDTKKYKVKSVSIDDYCKNNNIDHINFLKVDVEGAELMVFRGAESMMQNKKIDYILFEVNKNIKNFGYTQSDLISFIKDSGYLIFEIDKKPVRLIPQHFNYNKTINLLAVLANKKNIRKLIEKKYVSKP